MNDTPERRPERPSARARATPLGEETRDRAARACRRHGHRGHGRRRYRHRGRRGLLQHRHDRLSGDPDRPVLCRADRHLHLPAYRQCRHQQRGHRDGEPRGGVRRARLRAPGADHASLQLPRGAGLRRVAEGPRHHRHHRRRHPRADRADPREGHAERGDRACARRQVRPRRAEARGCRLPRHGRARPRQGRDLRPELYLGRDRVALGRGLWARDQRRASMSSPSTTA